MKLLEFDQWARSTLEFSEIDSIDSALNGVQVGSFDADISKMIFAVDACEASFLRARDEGAEVLFVHHGIYWGFVYPLTGVRGERVRYLMNNGIALYACHLPLDRHPVLGNNAQMAQILGLEEVEGFGDYKGRMIGCRGLLSVGEELESIVARLFGLWDNSIRALRFGPKEIHTVGIISGGAVYEVSQAIDAGLDLYITGDASHNIYHECREAGINVLFAGHYLTEVFGVRAMAQRVHQELGLETKFIDIPTGL
ncbi:MAG: Nif3-like dinuclear metal center hexameric protein [Spirochaeta sp. LUC14_002_19_P3]|nr:MAG: Nif3-like dinuclear metal center hexameric protein [Spirochaeta sp. LUC14_002_19_P3]